MGDDPPLNLSPEAARMLGTVVDEVRGLRADVQELRKSLVDVAAKLSATAAKVGVGGILKSLLK